MNTSSSVGLLLGAGLAVALATVVGRRWLISCGVCGAALGRLGLALTAIPWLWASAGCFRNAAIQGSNASLTAIWQERTPVEVQGTVFGARRLLGQGPFPLAVLLGGLIADYVVTPGAPVVQWAGAVFSQVDGPGSGLAILLALLALPELIIGLFLLRSGALRRLSLVSEVATEQPVQTTRDQVGEAG